MTQSQALLILKTGAHVFLTGEPGSGKTHTANEYVANLRSCGIDVAVTASTGIAATHMGGTTIHSWCGIGVKTVLEKRDVDGIARSKHVSGRIKRARVLVIEEISMLSGGTLSLVDLVCRRIRNNPAPFGGLQVVLVGDFFQLPPIVKREFKDTSQLTLIQEKPTARFAYDTPVWKELMPTVCYLTEQHRQDDSDFLAILSALRRNLFNSGHLRSLQTRKIEHSAAPEGIPKLFSHNADVDRVNDHILARLPGSSRTCRMSTHGPSALVSSLQKWCLSPAELHLKIGAAVMFTKNNQKEGFVNGTLGVVERFSPETGFPTVRTRSGKRIDVEPMDWVVEEHGEVRAKITQLPLRLAWALTVHKSQGMSLDEAIVDLTGVFEFGQGYVALSRVRRLSGLYLLGWNSKAFQVHPDVLTQDAAFRTQSEDAAGALSRLAVSGVSDLHQRFVDKNSGTGERLLSKIKRTVANPYAQALEKNFRAYRQWDDEQDEMLREMYSDGSSIADIAKEFSRTVGSIRSRLAKLHLLDGDGSAELIRDG